MLVKDLTCELMNPIYFNLDTHNWLDAFDLTDYQYWHIIQISADVDKFGHPFVLIDISEKGYCEDAEY